MNNNTIIRLATGRTSESRIW